MKLGELLIRANLATENDVSAALQRQVSQGGTLGDNLVALGLIDARTINRFIHRVPQEPADIESIGIPDTDLLALFMKLMFSARMEKIGQLADAIKLPQHIVMDLANLAIERQLIYTLGVLAVLLSSCYGHCFCLRNKPAKRHVTASGRSSICRTSTLGEICTAIGETQRNGPR